MNNCVTRNAKYKIINTMIKDLINFEWALRLNQDTALYDGGAYLMQLYLIPGV